MLHNRRFYAETSELLYPTAFINKLANAFRKEAMISSRNLSPLPKDRRFLSYRRADNIHLSPS